MTKNKVKEVKNDLDKMESAKAEAEAFLKNLQMRECAYDSALNDYNRIKDRNTELTKKHRALLNQRVSALTAEQEAKYEALRESLRAEKVELLNANAELMNEFKQELQYEHYPEQEKIAYENLKDSPDMEKNPFYIQAKKEVEAEHKKDYEDLKCDGCFEITPALNENLLCEDCQVDIEVNEEAVEVDHNWEWDNKYYDEIEEIEREARDSFQVINREPEKVQNTDIINKMFEELNI